MIIITFSILFIVLIIDCLFFFILISNVVSEIHGAPFVPTPYNTSGKSLQLANVGNTDIVFDLGCGDGRLLLLAIREFNAKKAIGYEIAPWPYFKARFLTRRFKNKIRIYRRNLLKADLSEATVVVLYLMQGLLENLRSKLEKELPKNTRVVSVGFRIPGWQEDSKDNSTGRPIWLYKIKRSEML